jgi:ABC-type uncharacterized transport system substrate-binding protein
LPLEKPVPADAAGFTFAVTDPSFFIAFDFAEKDTEKLGATAPHGCKAAIHEPPESDDTQQLNQAFSDALGSPGGSVNLGGGKTVAVECAKS